LNQEKYSHWQRILDEKRDGKQVVGLNTGCGPRWNTRLWKDENWVELAGISVQDIVQTQFQTKLGMKLDKKDALFVEFSYPLKMLGAFVVKQF
jgi:hypothetical protein